MGKIPFIRFWAKLSLRARMLLLTGLVFTGSGAVSQYFLVMEEREQYRGDISLLMDSTLELLEQAVAPQAVTGDYASIEQILATQARQRILNRIRWRAPDGTELRAAGQATPSAAPRWFRDWVALKPTERSRDIEVGGVHYGTLSIRCSGVPIVNRLWESFLHRLGKALFLFATFYAAIWLLLENELKPLESLVIGVRRFLAGDYGARVDIPALLAPEIRNALGMVNRAGERVGALLLSLSEQRRAVGNAAIVSETDLDGAITWVNDRFCEISGYRRAELLGRDHRILNSGLHPESLFAGLWATIRKGEVWRGELCNRTRSGDTFWVSTTITPVAGMDGRPVKFVMVSFDITALKLSEELLWQQARIIDQSHDAIFSTDMHGAIVSWNRGAEALFGYSREEIFAEPVAYLWPLEGQRGQAEAFERVRASGAGITETTLCRRSGETFFVHLSLTVLRDREGQPIGMVGYVIDITERKRAEEELRISQEQLRDLSAYLQTVREEEKAHIAREIHDELGGTLTALKMDVFWLAKKLPHGEPCGEKLEAMSKLVDSAVQTTRRIATELRPTVLDDLGLLAALEWQAGEFRKRTGIECRLKADGLEIEPEERRDIALFRIFQEALTNVARHAHASRVEVDLRQDGDNILMEIQDDGIGISEDKILRPTSHGIRGMIERARQLGGELVIAVGNGGATIRVRLPIR